MTEPRHPDRLVLYQCSGDTNVEFVTERTGRTVKVGRKDRGNRWPSHAVKDDAVSQKHAELSWDSEKSHWTATDVGSSNGSSLNSCRLEADGMQSQADDPGPQVYWGFYSHSSAAQYPLSP